MPLRVPRAGSATAWGGTEPLEYEFDFDDDGKPENVGSASTARHTYARPGTYKVRITVRNLSWGTKRSEVLDVPVGAKGAAE